MGVSNNAILAFGFALGDECERPQCLNVEGDEDDTYETFDDMVLAKSGLQEPEGKQEYKSKDNSPEWKHYYQKANEIMAACPVEIVWYCSYDYPMYFIALKGTEQKAYRGYAEKVTMREIKPEEIAAFKSFCEEYEIEWEEPAWSIFSMNG